MNISSLEIEFKLLQLLSDVDAPDARRLVQRWLGEYRLEAEIPRINVDEAGNLAWGTAHIEPFIDDAFRSEIASTLSNRPPQVVRLNDRVVLAQISVRRNRRPPMASGAIE